MACIKFIPARITKIWIDIASFDDDILLALAKSPCASTLERLRIAKKNHQAGITAASAQCWGKFSNLRLLSLTAPFACRVCLEAIATNLSRLEKLVLKLMRRPLPYSEVLSLLLSGDKLPSLHHLQVDSGTPHESKDACADKVLQILRSRSGESNALLQDIGLTVQHVSMDVEMARSFLELCPRLNVVSTLPAVSRSELLGEFPPILRHTQSFIGRLGPSTSTDPVEIALMLPASRTLLFNSYALSGGDFRGFSQLKSLCISAPENFVALTHLPPTLRELVWHSGRGALRKSAAVEALNTLYDLVVSSQPRLETLCLSVPCFPDPSRVKNVLTSLTTLKTLALDAAGDYEDGPVPITTIVVSHPNLVEEPRVTFPHISIEIGYCPAIHRFNIMPKHKNLSRLAECLPNAYRFGIRTQPAGVALAPFGQRVQELAVVDPVPAQDWDGLISKFSRLTRLGVRVPSGVTFATEALKLSLARLPLLLSLEVYTPGGFDNLAGVTHPLLSSLSLSQNFAGRLTRPPNGVDFHCSGRQLPNLVSVSLSLPAINLIVDDAPRCNEISVTSSACAVAARNCPVLRVVLFNECTILKLRVTVPAEDQASGLRRISLNSCNLSPLLSESDSGLPLELPQVLDAEFHISMGHNTTLSEQLHEKYPRLKTWIFS